MLRRIGVTAATVFALAAQLSPVAYAEVRSGTSADPVGDGTAALNRDIESASAAFDPQEGTVSVTVHMAEALDASGTGTLNVKLTDEGCNYDASPQSALLLGNLRTTDQVVYWFSTGEGTYPQYGSRVLGADKRDITFSATGPGLRLTTVTCIQVEILYRTSDGDLQTLDALNNAIVLNAGGADPSPPPPPPPEQEADTAAPQLVEFDFTPKTVDVSTSSRQVTVTARITDDTGAQAPYFVFASDTTSQTTAFGQMTRTSGTARDGVYSIKVNIPRGAAPGTWHASLYPLEDTVGHSGSFGPPAGFPNTLNVTSADTTPPDTVIVSGPSGVTSSASPSFEFSSEPGASFDCRLDAGDWTACSSPKSYTNLGDGEHTFRVRATDALGNTDVSEATRTWTVDTIAPRTTITAGPSGTVSATSATFTFTGSETGSKFECRLDSGSGQPCSSPRAYAGLARGEHTFRVRAIDAAGNTGAEASSVWTIAAADQPPQDRSGSTSNPQPGAGSGGGSAVPTPTDSQPPTSNLSVRAGLTLKSVVRSGLPLTVRCSEACSITAEALLSRSAATKLGLAARSRLVRVGRATKPLGDAGTAPLRLKLSRAAGRKLKHTRAIRVTIRITVRDAAGNASVRTRRVMLRNSG